MNELWLSEAAEEFWHEAGGYSQGFELALLVALPITFERLSGLSISSARRWLANRRVSPTIDLATLADRPLRACLIALGGASNFILLEAQDAPDEQLFSLAHEVAHFLLDYLRPRRQAERKLSASILPILDGQRPSTLEERVYGLLANLSLQPYHHLMERHTPNEATGKVILQAEDRADRLAIELLAPLELVLPLVKEAIIGLKDYSVRRQATQQILTDTYRLPVSIAEGYSPRVLEEAGGGRTFREWLNYHD